MKRRGEFKLEFDLGARARADRENKKRLRNLSESAPDAIPELHWGQNKGEFNSFRDYDERFIENPEQDVVNHLKRLSEQRKQAGIQRPVIALDFGGMFGLSMAKVAAQLEKEIAASEIALVVTNLAFPIKKGLALIEAGKLPDQANHFSEAEQQTVVDHHSKLHYVQSDAAELRHQQITLPNGEVVPLDGNIDFLHERFAMTHSSKGDVDLLLLAKRMSSDGVMALASNYAFRRTQESDVSHITRMSAMNMGFDNILQLGFAEGAPSHFYQFFHRPDADVSSFTPTTSGATPDDINLN